MTIYQSRPLVIYWSTTRYSTHQKDHVPQPLRRLSLRVHRLIVNAWGLIRAQALLWIHAGVVPRLAIFEGRAPVLRVPGCFRVGARLKLRSTTQRSSLSTGVSGTLVLGDRVFINQGSCIHAERSVSIGDRVSIGDGARIYDTNFHPVRPGQPVKIEPVVIEDDVWLAAGVTVLAGVTIGRGSVIGAGAVVTRSVGPGSLVVSPAASTIERFPVPPAFRRTP